MNRLDLTNSDLLRAPGGPYAVLHRLRQAADPHHTVRSAPPQDPWRRPNWEQPTVYLQLYLPVR